MFAAEAVHQEKREMEIPGNGKKILGISSNYHYYSITNFCGGPWEIMRNLECISDGFLPLSFDSF